MKTCRRCNQAKPLFDFNKKCDTADGLTSRCKSCLAEVRKADYERRGDAIRAKNTEWYADNRESVQQRRKEVFDPEQNKIQCKRYYEANKERVRAMNRAWEAKNYDKVLASWRKYAKANTENRMAIYIRRRAALVNQYPAWERDLTDFVTKEAVRLARLRSKITGFQWDVDHIVPLMGRRVAGFHVWNNLQVIPALENRSKSNKFEVTA